MTDPELERLRGLFRDEVSSVAAEPRPDVEALLGGGLEPREARELAARTIDDPEIALEVRVAASMREALAEEGEQAPEVVPFRPRSNTSSRLVWAAVAAIAAGLLVFILVRPKSVERTEETTVRAGDANKILAAENTEALPSDAFDLQWSGGPATATYDLFVTTPELEPVYQALDLEEPKHRVPQGALFGHASGTRLLWRVVAVSPEGRKVHSGVFEVEVR